jgi:plastocyanin
MSSLKHYRPTLPLAVAAALIAALLLATQLARAAEVAATIQEPATLTVNVGDRVTWTNQDTAPHTVTSDTAGVFDVRTEGSGGTGSLTFNTAGTFPFHCTIHPNMKGTMVVQAAGGGPAAPSTGTGLAGQQGGAALNPLAIMLLGTLAAAGGGASMLVLQRRKAKRTN